jgi:hypothetical protein
LKQIDSYNNKDPKCGNENLKTLTFMTQNRETRTSKKRNGKVNNPKNYKSVELKRLNNPKSTPKIQVIQELTNLKKKR